jgi:hypothetical protein
MLVVLVERRREKPERIVLRGDEERPEIRVGNLAVAVRFASGGATILASERSHRVIAGSAKVFWTGGQRVSAWIE